MTNARRIVDAGWPEEKDKHKSSPIKDKIKKARQSRKKNWEKRIDELARQIYDDLKVEESIIDAAQRGMAKKIWNFTESKTFCEKIRMEGDHEYNKEIFTQLNVKKGMEKAWGPIEYMVENNVSSSMGISQDCGFVDLVNNIGITPKHIISRLKEIFIQNGIDTIKIIKKKKLRSGNRLHLDFLRESSYRTGGLRYVMAVSTFDQREEAYEKLTKLKFYESIECSF